MCYVTATQERIASQVRAELARQGKGRGFLVELLGLHPTSMSLRLSGKRSFRAEELVAIADALGISAARFFDEERVA